MNTFVDSLWDQLNITLKTKKNYQGAYSRNLQPCFGEMEIAKVSKADLVNQLSKLTQQSKYQTLMVARVIFREAIERELIHDNPAARIKAPRVEVQPQKFFPS